MQPENPGSPASSNESLRPDPRRFSRRPFVFEHRGRTFKAVGSPMSLDSPPQIPQNVYPEPLKARPGREVFLHCVRSQGADWKSAHFEDSEGLELGNEKPRPCDES